MKRRITIGLTAALAGLAIVGLAAPAQAQRMTPENECHARHWTYNANGGTWRGMPTDGSGSIPSQIYGSPYDISDYGVTNSDGSIDTFCG